MVKANKLIWLFSGTSDGNQIAARLLERGYAIKVFVASDFGMRAASMFVPSALVRVGRLDSQGLNELGILDQPAMVLDATHPYAIEITKNLMAFCLRQSIPYTRYDRPEEFVAGRNMHVVDGVQEAATCAMALGKRVLLTTGSKNIDAFIDAKFTGEIFVRMLPDPELIRQVLEKGIRPSNVIAMQGPFNKSLNKSIIDNFKIDCLVTKSSGREGGYADKVEAALETGIPVVVIKRPELKYPGVYQTSDDLLQFIDLWNSGKATPSVQQANIQNSDLKRALS